MRKLVFILFSLSLTCVPVFAWTTQYECNVEPDAATPAWTLTGTDETSASGGIITMNTTGTNTNYYTIVWTADNTTGWTIETKAKVITSTWAGANDDRCRLMDGGDGTRVEIVYAYEDRIVAYDNGSLTEHAMDTTDRFHTYRLTVEGTVGKVYVDNALVLTTTTLANAADRIQFGDMAATNGFNNNVQWDYVYWDETGAFAPTSSQVILTSTY